MSKVKINIMIINKVIIKNLYGYINKDIKFNKDINLLVGINGSGKTSVLNIINWLLIPSFPNLCVTEFDKIEIDFSFNNETYVITGKQNERELTIDLENVTKKIKYNQVQVDFSIHPKKITRNSELRERHMSDYMSLEPEKKEVETWSFLFKEIPNPIVIGLDRYIYTEEGNSFNFVEPEYNIRRLINGKKNPQSPLDKVMQLSSIEYSHYKNKILELNKRLNNKIMLSSFDETLTHETLDEIIKSPKITLKQVESLEIKVKEYFQENIYDKRYHIVNKSKQQREIFEKIEQYFTNLKSILSPSQGSKKENFNILYITNLNQFRKIKELIKEFEEFENKGKKFFEPLKQYLQTINVFFKDSAKELYFDKNTSKLKFRIFNQYGVIQENREIDDLSSGEKQILILFTYIKFNSKLGKLFIIDEPELSLHPKWQEIFLESIKEIMPSNTQLLFATHSPAVVGKNKSYCKVLLPY